MHHLVADSWPKNRIHGVAANFFRIFIAPTQEHAFSRALVRLPGFDVVREGSEILGNEIFCFHESGRSAVDRAGDPRDGAPGTHGGGWFFIESDSVGIIVRVKVPGEGELSMVVEAFDR
jgi:hypothetical protein